MKKKIGLVITGGLLAFGMVTNAFAAEYPLYIGNGTVNYKKTLSEDLKGKSVTFTVIKEGKAWNDAEWENPQTDAIVYADSTTVDNTGAYSFNFLLDKSGVYNVISAVGGSTQNDTEKFEVIINSEAKAAIGILKDKETKSEIETAISGHKGELGLTSESFEDISSDLSDIILNSKSELSESDVESTVTVLKKALKAAEFNSGKISTVSGIEDTIGILKSDYEKWYNKSFDEDIVKRLTKKEFKTVKAFEDAVKEAVLLERIENPDGNADIVSIISENYKDMGLSKSNLSLSEASKLAGKSFESYGELEEEISKLGSSKGQSGGGGSYSAGGGSSFGSNINFTEPQKSEEDKKPASRFLDMQNHKWAEEAIEALALNGIVNGRGNNEFVPGDFVTREEFAKMIVTLFNFNVVKDSFGFEDVPDDSWYYEYVRRAYGSNVVKGISDTMFGSGRNIIRQDAFVMAYNAMKYNDTLPYGEVKKEFFDADEISDYAKEATEALSAAGIINGDEKGNVSPKADITRAEAAMIIYNIMIKLNL